MTASRAPSSSAELGQQSKSLIFELGRPRPSSAELGRGQPSSGQLGRGQPSMPTELGPNKCIFFFAPDGQKMSSSIFMIWNSLVTNQFELATDLHSPHSNGNFERQDFGEGLEALSSLGPEKMFSVCPELAGDSFEKQENTKDCDCWLRSVELGRARRAVKIFDIRTRPASAASSAEVSRAQPSSAGVSRECRRSRGPPNVIFLAPDGQKMSSSVFMIWNSLITNQFELETDLHSPRSNGVFEW